MRCTVLVVLLFVLACPLRAQEIYAGGGVSREQGRGDTVAQWSVSYVEGLGENVQVSLTYLNEGHHPNHYRDGLAPQIWLRTNTMARRLSLGAGIGPYFFFDTHVTGMEDTYSNAHGVGLITSAAAVWYGTSPVLFRLCMNWIQTANSFDTISATVGAGYQFEAPPTPGPSARPARQGKRTTENEITVYAGRAVLNSANSEQGTSFAVEYRHGLLRHVDLTISLLTEGDSRPIGRHGAMSQIWAVRAFADDRLAFGFGMGPYLARDKYSGDDGPRTTLAGAVSLTAGIRISPRWAFRITFNRIVTDYSRDTDVFLGGLTFRF